MSITAERHDAAQHNQEDAQVSLSGKGLTDEQAAQIHFLLSNCADAFTYGDADRYDTASNVPLKVLRAEYPDSPRISASKKDRIAIIS